MTSYFNNFNMSDTFPSYPNDENMNTYSMYQEWLASRATWFDTAYTTAASAASTAWVWTRDNVIVDDLDRFVYTNGARAFNWSVNAIRDFKMPAMTASNQINTENMLFALGVIVFTTWIVGNVMSLCRLRRAIDERTAVKMAPPGDPVDDMSEMDGFTKPRRRERRITRSMTAALDKDIRALMPSTDMDFNVLSRSIFIVLRDYYPYLTMELVQSRICEIQHAVYMRDKREREFRRRLFRIFNDE